MEAIGDIIENHIFRDIFCSTFFFSIFILEATSSNCSLKCVSLRDLSCCSNFISRLNYAVSFGSVRLSSLNIVWFDYSFMVL